MNIAVAGDHSAVAHTRAIIAHLKQSGHQVEDFGTTTEASCDYPDLAGPACESVAKGRNERVVLVCGTGIGVSIVANKTPGIRCGLAHNVGTARLAREHNNAQALALGARIVDIPTALEMVDAWLSANFEDRHQRRLDKIAARESCTLTTKP
jgi:ribose 5-phosphate isomerase B